MTQNSLTHTRFEFLDALRGVAALCVMFYHFAQYQHVSFFYNAQLSVDFFFILSGFVLMHAYGQAIKNGMSAKDYLMKRCIRLYPMFLAGLCLGSATLVILRQDILLEPSLRTLSLVFAHNVFYIPKLGGLPFKNLVDTGIASDMIFPLNPPSWSLFFEMIASAAFLILAKLRQKTLIKIAGASFITLLFFGGLVKIANFDYGFDLNIGWGTSNFFGGFPRVFYGFTLGVLLYKLFQEQKIPQAVVRALSYIKSPTSLYALLFLILVFPLGFKGLYPMAVLLVLAPYCVLAGAQMKSKGKFAKRLAKRLGDLSYPVYCLHFPIGLVCFHEGEKLGWTTQQAMIAAVLTTLALSTFLLYAYDAPVRRWLNKKLSTRNKAR